MTYTQPIEYYEGLSTADQTQIHADMAFYTADGMPPLAGGSAVVNYPPTKGSSNHLAVTYSAIRIP